MEYIITELLDITIETLLLYIFFHPTKSMSRKYICIFSTLVLLVFLYLFPEEGMLAFIDIIINIFLILFLLEETWYNKIFSFMFIYFFTGFVYQSFILISDILMHFSAFNSFNSMNCKIFFKTITVIFLSILLTLKIKKKYLFYLSLLNKLFLSIFCILICLCLSILQMYGDGLSSYYLYLFAIISIIAVCSIIFYLLSASDKNREIEKNNIQSKYITMLKSYYTEIEKNETELRKIRHDMKNHIHVLTGLMVSSDYERAQNYLQQINDLAISKIVTVPNTGNILLNAILLQKTYEFSDVKINFKGTIKDDISMADYDFTAIIGNLLDNALEYSRLHQFPEIILSVYQEPPALLIHISNQTEGYIKIKQLGKHSSKPGRNHGYGISNVKEALHKYHGRLQYCQEDDLLTVKVQLSLNEL